VLAAAVMAATRSAGPWPCGAVPASAPEAAAGAVPASSSALVAAVAAAWPRRPAAAVRVEAAAPPGAAVAREAAGVFRRRAAAPHMDAAVGIVGREPGETVLQIAGLDPLAADEGLAAAVEAQDDRLARLRHLGRAGLRQVERHADGQERRGHHEDDQEDQ